MPTKTTLKNLRSRLTKRVESVELETNEAKKKMARLILNQLVEATPVDISTLISNWIILSQEGGQNILLDPVSSGGRYRFAHFPGEKGSTRVASMAKTLRLGYSKIRYSRRHKAIRIINNTPYLVYLNTFNHGGHGGFADANLNIISKSVMSKFKVKYKV